MVTYLKGDSLDEDEVFKFVRETCPDCSGRLVDGPEGGGSMNVYCRDATRQCGSRFNIGVGSVERITPRSPNATPTSNDEVEATESTSAWRRLVDDE